MSQDACRTGNGLLDDTSERQVWIVSWPGVPGTEGGAAWAVFDAHDGSMLVTEP